MEGECTRSNEGHERDEEREGGRVSEGFFTGRKKDIWRSSFMTLYDS